MATTIAIDERPALDPEDQARADWYALLARLFYAPPDAPLLATLAGLRSAGAAPGSAFTAALDALASASAATSAEAARADYDDLFLGAGKARVTLYVTHYLVQTGREKLLVRLRDDLAAQGLARKTEALEPEDHLAGICELMRHLIVRGGTAGLAEQQAVFDRYLARSVGPLTAAMEVAAADAFHRALARLVAAFIAVEAEAFAMDE